MPVLSAEQSANATTIVAVGQRSAVPLRGQVVAVVTALQESGLRNLPFGDRDSLGLFQQRPSQGWGTATQILDPGYAASRFYVALLTVPGWRRLPVAAAAQAVQRSAFPDGYARWEDEAAGVVGALTASTPVSSIGCGASSDTGTTMTPAAVRTVLAFAAAQVGDRYVLGANGPDSWDCSSLVQAAFWAAGVALPRTAAAQYGWLEARGQLATGPVRLVSLRPGDLLFSRGAEPRLAARRAAGWARRSLRRCRCRPGGQGLGGRRHRAALQRPRPDRGHRRRPGRDDGAHHPRPAASSPAERSPS